MLEQFAHTATTSFILWFDNYLLSRGQAFTNKTGILYSQSDDRLDPRFKAFASPYKQWVADSSVGANVPTGISINGGISGRDNGVIFDFDNGRVLTSGSSASVMVTGSFAVKDFNVYFTNEGEEDLLIDKKYIANPRVHSPQIGAIPPYDIVTPAILISNGTHKNEPFAFGGEDTSRVSMKAVILTDNSYQLDGVLSLFADSQDAVIPQIPMSGSPYTEYGDLKTGYYSYNELKNSFGPLNPIFFVEDVTPSKLSDKASKTITNSLFVGFLDFEICQQRYPRQ